MKTTDFSRYLTKYFTKYLPNECGSSPQTIDSYRTAFILYLEYTESSEGINAEKITVKDFTKESVIGFLNWLEEDRENSRSTRNHRLAAIKSFVHYLKYEFPEYLEEYQLILSIPLKKAEKKEISYLKTDGVKLLIDQIDISDLNGLRDFVMISVLYTTGIRVSELINIKVKDISLTEPFTIKVHGKGNKGRYVPLMKTTTPYIKRYLSLMKFDCESKMNEYFFINHMGEQFTRQGVNYILKNTLTKPEK